MVLCPVALAVGCKKCPVVSICPLKSTLGNFKKEAPAEPAAKPSTKKKPPARRR